MGREGRQGNVFTREIETAEPAHRKGKREREREREREIRELNVERKVKK